MSYTLWSSDTYHAQHRTIPRSCILMLSVRDQWRLFLNCHVIVRKMGVSALSPNVFVGTGLMGFTFCGIHNFLHQTCCVLSVCRSYHVKVDAQCWYSLYEVVNNIQPINISKAGLKLWYQNSRALEKSIRHSRPPRKKWGFLPQLPLWREMMELLCNYTECESRFPYEFRQYDRVWWTQSGY